MTREKLKAKALLIDLDGTIVDSREAFARAAETALYSIGKYSRSFDNLGWEIARLLQLNLPLDKFFDKTGIDIGLRDKFLKLFLKSFYNIAPSKTKRFLNVDKTLCKLSRKFLLALITRRPVPESIVKKELERLRLNSYFTTIVTALEVKKPTPLPDTLLKAADKLQVSIHDCIVVSDSGVDIKAGKSAGTKTVAVLSGLFMKKELQKETPNLIIKDINHLPEHLLTM